MSIRFAFPGAHALVTGGGQGIGLAIAQAFGAAGAQVTVWDYAEESLARARAELPAAALERVDVGDFAACAAAASRLKAPLSFLINNAGITRDKTVAKLTPEDFDAVVRVNLTGAFHCVKATLDRFDPACAEKRIINLSSVVALYGNFGQTNYAAAKAGLIGMTKTLARELGRKGFTVNAIAPGFIDTPMTRAVPKDVLDGMAAKVPRGRLGRVDDIAAACLYLASPEAGYVNGSVLSVDGGLVV